jgi:hypothetical protein
MIATHIFIFYSKLKLYTNLYINEKSFLIVQR